MHTIAYYSAMKMSCLHRQKHRQILRALAKGKKQTWITDGMIPFTWCFGKGKATVTEKDQCLPEVQGGGEKNE